MSFIVIMGVVVAGWTFLNVLGSERQKELAAYRRQWEEEHQPAAAPARPLNVPGAASAKPALPAPADKPKT